MAEGESTSSRSTRQDIVVTDINMPVMDGIQMAVEIRALNAGAKIIAVSARSDTNFLLDAIRIGINRYVLKPIDLTMLFEAMDDCIAHVKLNRQIEVQSNFIRKLSLAVEQSTDMIIIANSKGAIEYVNPMFSRIAGYSAKEVTGQHLRVLLANSAPLDSFEMLWSAITGRGRPDHGPADPGEKAPGTDEEDYRRPLKYRARTGGAGYQTACMTITNYELQIQLRITNYELRIVDAITNYGYT